MNTLKNKVRDILSETLGKEILEYEFLTYLDKLSYIARKIDDFPNLKEWEEVYKNRFSDSIKQKIGLELARELYENNFNSCSESRLIVFDKDGTLTNTKSGKDFSKSPDDQKLIFKNNDFSDCGTIAIATNQKGISLGFKTQDFFQQEIFYLRRKLDFWFEYCVACPDDGENILLFSPDNLKASTELENNSPHVFKAFERENFGIKESLKGTFRKPKGGMLLALEQLIKYDYSCMNHPVDFTEKILVGNTNTDKQAAINAKFEYYDFKDWSEINTQ